MVTLGPATVITSLLRSIFESLAPELAAPIVEEETDIFPVIRNLEGGTVDKSTAHPALRSSLAKLEREHEHAGAALARLRELTNDFCPPEWACNTFRALFDSLERFETNMHEHVHKENNVLFPKALAVA